jgi:molybdate-binding protein
MRKWWTSVSKDRTLDRIYYMTNTVNDRQTFSDFIDKLRQDLKANPSTWTNKNLDEFLEAMNRYTQDIDGYYKNTNQNINADTPSWQVFADILMGAKVYE